MRAAASGDSGSGKRASSWVSVTPDSRVTVTVEISGRVPVTHAGLGGLDDGDAPPRRASAAMAAVTTVLPTPVPVPVTTSTPGAVTERESGAAG